MHLSGRWTTSTGASAAHPHARRFLSGSQLSAWCLDGPVGGRPCGVCVRVKGRAGAEDAVAVERSITHPDVCFPKKHTSCPSDAHVPLTRAVAHRHAPPTWRRTIAFVISPPRDG